MGKVSVPMGALRYMVEEGNERDIPDEARVVLETRGGGEVPLKAMFVIVGFCGALLQFLLSGWLS